MSDGVVRRMEVRGDFICPDGFKPKECKVPVNVVATCRLSVDAGSVVAKGIGRYGLCWLDCSVQGCLGRDNLPPELNPFRSVVQTISQQKT